MGDPLPMENCFFTAIKDGNLQFLHICLLQDPTLTNLQHHSRLYSLEFAKLENESAYEFLLEWNGKSD